MKDQIENYINRMVVIKQYNKDWTEEIEVWYIHGDGVGDFEESAPRAHKRCVEDYITSCLDQIELAKRYLKELNK